MAMLPKGAIRRYALSYYELDIYTHKPRYELIFIGAYGETKDSVEENARNEVAAMPVAGEIYRETLQKNLFVVSESVAKRSYSRAVNNYYEALETAEY